MAADLLLLSTAEHRAHAESHALSGTGSFPRLPQVFEGFQLTVDDAPHLAMTVAFVGILEGKGLLVSAPDCDALAPGVAVHGRLLFGRDVCAFRTRVAARSVELGGLVLLDSPQNVRRHPVRRHRRVQAAIPARVIRNDSESFEAKAVDISLEGVGLTSDTLLLEAGEHFRLALRLTTEGKSHSLLLNCVARNIRANSNGFVFGAEIRAAAVEARAVLRNFVFETATGTTF
ncbi:PilZ domain-containing protein [Paraburkholderia sp. CNPSo 3272]|uniref:PilZ domain-containing protein n=1 Tax=Paraburkholderia sp. CNPSo 3272 TaxID=2940931 RepID=UPI0020B7D9F8|nr:PilZ domain-containing protein [Paraburkholderia sp. CNPSo 3272]MCP3725226.1 PilZ domain-containing protein [Paraburkholderia sp. CNPSo 3272]